MHWQTTRHRIDLSQPRVMGIVNVTPDSFSDGGRHADTASAVAHAERLLREGADILDIGGESTRPGAAQVDAGQEWARVGPVLAEVLKLGCPVSIDTMKAEVMARALALGVDIVNDIAALRDPGALTVVAGHPSCGVCLMHMQGEPRTMQHEPRYGDVVAEVRGFLGARLQALLDRGLARERITLDPGYGFGKSVEHNLALWRGQRQLLGLGQPLLVGWSRKSTLGAITGRAPAERVVASVAAALASVERGAAIVRVHDVVETVDALKVWTAAKLPE